jgi:hypothetical protein
MLNYMGPNIGSSPVTASLAPATPGTMPAGIPGAPPPVGAPGPLGSIMPGHLNAPPPPQVAQAIQQAAPSGPGAPPAVPNPDDPNDPSHVSNLQYTTQTQADGTVVLFLTNPDGTQGPAVKIIKVGAAAAQK